MIYGSSYSIIKIGKMCFVSFLTQNIFFGFDPKAFILLCCNTREYLHSHVLYFKVVHICTILSFKWNMSYLSHRTLEHNTYTRSIDNRWLLQNTVFFIFHHKWWHNTFLVFAKYVPICYVVSFSLLLYMAPNHFPDYSKIHV